MRRYLLDTNICSRIILGDVHLEARAQAARKALCTCAVVAGELVLMSARSARPAENEPRIRRLLAAMPVLPIDAVVADVYGDLKADLFAYYGPATGKRPRKVKLQHFGLSDNVVWIAAAALSCGATLVSQDGDFQRILPVRSMALETWSVGS